jgi:hypothetical protein
METAPEAANPERTARRETGFMRKKSFFRLVPAGTRPARSETPPECQSRTAAQAMLLLDRASCSLKKTPRKMPLNQFSHFLSTASQDELYSGAYPGVDGYLTRWSSERK